ncbi:activin types I and II receptor domain protein [Ancylostoma ceylanicum]|uniref:Serine/threonine-protein kinase receptor n=1 Tax=Ancylostoma ceylanicum TaxID=53326 RepID=A0A0D6L850_9BILA|nr:activin types I and II receptor domain protein [Ancylostoma ceylanicum]
MLTLLFLYLYAHFHYSAGQAESSDLSIPEEAVGRPQYPLPIRDELLDEDTRNLCFCNYEGDICDANNTCIKHSHAACFHFMKECNSFRSPHRTPKSIACCYEGNYCNLRITPPPYRQLPKEAEYYDDEWLESKLHPMFHVVVPLIIALFAIAIAATWCILKKRRSDLKKWLPLDFTTFSEEEAGTPAYTGAGSNDVRRFRAKFVAADIFSMDSLTQMILVTDYHPLGSLYDYLQKEQALTTQEALQLAYRYISCCVVSRIFENLQSSSSICGIEHLHASVLGTGSRRKPQIAHRDIKSKNIIVKRPGVCCIADFGLAVRFEDRLIPEKVNIQVGTKRYMAPEVIRKALNPNFFAQFKMADMYSYALVLWEIARKVEVFFAMLTKTSKFQCADVCGTSIGSGESGYNSASSEGKGLTIYSEMKSENYKMQHMQKSSDGSRRSYPYKPPFGELVDSDPSFAEMEKIVCGANGKRPPLELSWTNGSNVQFMTFQVHLQKMVSLMVDCWHHSPHCRHTALKVKIALGEVIDELLLLQEREAMERMTSQAMRAIDEEVCQPSRVVILGAQSKKGNAHSYLATC